MRPYRTKELKHLAQFNVQCIYNEDIYGSLFCLFGVFRPTQEFFTYMDTSPLPVKGYNFVPMLVICGHCTVTVRVL